MIISSSLTSKETQSSAEKLSKLLANTYLLYLKTQNYHWNIIDPYFCTLHEMFEKQYRELAEAIDEIAERIRIMGHPAPATFSEFLKLTSLSEDITVSNGYEILLSLLKDHQIIIEELRANIKEMDISCDEGTKDLLTSRLVAHEKIAWIIRSHS